MSNDHIDPALWQQSLGLARQVCARIFRDGGKPEDALKAFGIATVDTRSTDWSKVVDLVAQSLSAAPARRAA